MSGPDPMAAALDNAIASAAREVSHAGDEILAAATALSFELLAGGTKVDGATFLSLYDQARREYEAFLADSDLTEASAKERTDLRRAALAAAASEVAEQVRKNARNSPRS